MASFVAKRVDECSLDVIGLGQNSVDHICRVESYPPAGSKTDALDYHLLPGGQVATAILTAHRHGLKTCYVGAIGDDDLGRHACAVLEKEGVRLELKVVSDASTQFAMIIVDKTGERTIVERYDPRTVVGAEDVDKDLICSARMLHLDITDIPAALQAAKWARESKTLVSLDIDRMLPGTEELLGLVDLLVASEGLPEALGCPDPRLALYTLKKYCPGFVCITRGDRGCVALENSEAYRIPAFDVDVVDTTGCGDVFRGALIFGVLQPWPMAEALRYASAAAAIQAGSLGAQTGVPTEKRVRDFLKSPPSVKK
ncbi:MAG: PfkB family carbohydrate kinase [Pseudomonadota bacterium]